MERKYREVIEQATKLAERSIKAFEAERRLKEIEPQFEALAKKASDFEQKGKGFRSRVSSMADTLITRGVLDTTNKLAFVDSVCNNHEELVDVVERLSSEVKAETFGKAASDSGSDDFSSMDPFERMAMEG